ncbi:AAA family ATPase [Staphylococcus hominis]|uniref:AAA family ATPase n=1 Tax=Staphylococcus hominis TaxID=1290 RepID=UPI0012DD43C3|nr:ATP-dependent Clp protease ATP-binding subunit [Staphylococcus hominis]MCI2847730.1 ATP-dependent Clp protease ATP-binding subunit [Staphylococcus hominis]MCI2849783.1 ATP-dependent Clp protease ATP-binding subunit [Staphylococcus hominis]MCI2856511.1 ATP-dependent Clp protease ATP-binding subunit [Staphylococcus hominis]MCI2886905.1 ATP-dependent Clp protease ATP-binding subunit [Staphylococcus hominis]MDS3852159.1 ATP-dependent Clp protease ATP-binding subunit [Staphylococcus hominis]
MTATTNNVIEYKITKQCKEAFEKVLNLIAKKERKIIETQDLLLAFASTADTGAAYSLGRFSITKKKLEDEIKQAKLMDKRYIEINEDEFEQNDLFISQKKKRKIQEYIKTNQVQFIYESSTDQAIKYMSEYPISNNVKDIIDFAEEMRFQNNPSGGIDTYWIIMGMSQDEDCNAYHVLKKLMLKYDNIFDGDKMSERFQNRSYLANNYYDGRNEEEQRKNATIRNRISNKLADPSYSILEDITTDLTEKARNKELMPAIKREREIHHMEIALSRRDKNNVSLIGKGGVGKSAIVDGLALKIVNNEIPSLKNKKILQFSVNDLISVIQGEIFKGIQRFMSEMKREKDVILFIDEIHMLGKSKGLTDILKPAMARSDFRIIGATTPREWQSYISSDTALTRRFEIIKIDEPNVEDTVEIINQVIPIYENFHHVNFEKETIKLASQLGKKYFPKEQLPDLAFTILDNAGAICRIEQGQTTNLQTPYLDKMNRLKEDLKQAQVKEFNDEQVEKLRREIQQLEKNYSRKMSNIEKITFDYLVTKDHIKKAIEQRLGEGFEVVELKGDEDYSDIEIDRLSQLKNTMKSQIIGQDEAIETIANAVIRKKLGFKQSNRPVGVFMFLGTTGVGKTETAKILNKTLYRDEQNIIRYDMSEYQKEHEVSKLIGPPPGYIGFGQDGDLVKTVLEHPRAVILFDEIEKAHPKIFDVLLQVFDDGRLTNSLGETADFSESIILLTSNIGASDIQNRKVVGLNQTNKNGTDFEMIDESIREALKQYFRPEFLNRIDEMITFKPLNQQEIFEITHLLIKKEVDLIESMGYNIEFSNEAIRLIANLCYEPKNGARPIKRGISKLLEDRLSEEIINGTLKKGNTIKVTEYNNELLIDYI